MRSSKLILIAFVGLTLTGCAIGNQYDYRRVNIALPLTGSGELGVAVVDNRQYVLNGDKPADFVGLQRGGFANPFNVTTASGNSLTQDMSVSLQKGLRDSGYDVTELRIGTADPREVASAVAEGGIPRNAVLIVTEWKTDIYMNMKLSFDLLLQVVTAQGETIASNQMQGEEKLTGGGFESQNSQTAAATFETKVGRLFNHPDILEALRN